MEVAALLKPIFLITITQTPQVVCGGCVQKKGCLIALELILSREKKEKVESSLESIVAIKYPSLLLCNVLTCVLLPLHMYYSICIYFLYAAWDRARGHALSLGRKSTIWEMGTFITEDETRSVPEYLYLFPPPSI